VIDYVPYWKLLHTIKIQAELDLILLTFPVNHNRDNSFMQDGITAYEFLQRYYPGKYRRWMVYYYAALMKLKASAEKQYKAKQESGRRRRKNLKEAA